MSDIDLIRTTLGGDEYVAICGKEGEGEDCSYRLEEVAGALFFIYPPGSVPPEEVSDILLSVSLGEGGYRMAVVILDDDDHTVLRQWPDTESGENLSPIRLAIHAFRCVRTSSRNSGDQPLRTQSGGKPPVDYGDNGPPQNY